MTQFETLRLTLIISYQDEQDCNTYLPDAPVLKITSQWTFNIAQNSMFHKAAIIGKRHAALQNRSHGARKDLLDGLECQPLRATNNGDGLLTYKDVGT